MSIIIADYYYTDWGCLVDFMCNPGLKNCKHETSLMLLSEYEKWKPRDGLRNQEKN